MCQCRVTDCHKSTTLVKDVNNVIQVLGQRVYGKSLYLLNFAVSLKLLLYLFILIEFVGMMLVNKIIQASGVQFCYT